MSICLDLKPASIAKTWQYNFCPVRLHPEMKMFRLAIFSLCVLVCIACDGQDAKPSKAILQRQETRIRMATTTSVDAVGLLDALLPPFEERFGVKVDVIAVGTGKALKLGEKGDVDVVLVHAPSQEDAFIRAGFGVNRRELMYNDFVIVGPENDPAEVREEEVITAFRKIALSGSPFVSRGDGSGTHQKEKEIWQLAGIVPEGRWYLEVGQGMEQTLIIANEKQAYCLSDRSTFIVYDDKLSLTVLCEGDPRLLNLYSIIAVNPAKHPHVRYIEAMMLIGWMTSLEGQAMIRDFRKDGKPLFHPLAGGKQKAPFE